MVLFAPEDLNIVKGSPQIRRRFIDMELGQMSAVYLNHLSNYQRLLKQKSLPQTITNWENERSNDVRSIQ